MLLFSQEKKIKKSASITEKVTRKSSRSISFIDLAETEKAQWTNGRKRIPFPGKESDPLGWVRYRESVELEDKTTYSKVIETHPEWREKKGLLVGMFHVGKLPEDAVFKAKIGFLKGADQTDGVRIKVFSTRDPAYYTSKTCYYDGSLDDLVLPLDRFAGKDFQLVIKVFTLDSYNQDHVIWVDPRIEW
jgi:hypothetical protein